MVSRKKQLDLERLQLLLACCREVLFEVVAKLGALLIWFIEVTICHSRNNSYRRLCRRICRDGVPSIIRVSPRCHFCDMYRAEQSDPADLFGLMPKDEAKLNVPLHASDSALSDEVVGRGGERGS